MASLSGWTTENPANTSVWSQIDDQYRSDKSVERNVWEAEHYWDTGSAASAGYHKEGSFRPHHGPASSVSSVSDSGRLMWASDTSELHDASTRSTPFVLNRFEPAIFGPWISSETYGLLMASRAILPADAHLTADNRRGPSYFASWNTTKPLSSGNTISLTYVVVGSSGGDYGGQRRTVKIDYIDLWVAVDAGSEGTPFTLSFFTVDLSNLTPKI